MSNPAIVSSTNLFRRLTWQSTIPLEIRISEDDAGPSSSNRYFMHAPRYTYLPLLIPEIRENLVEIVLNDQQLAETRESDWWFEEDIPQSEHDLDQHESNEDSDRLTPVGPLKWHWPLDLIHLYSIISKPHTLDLTSPAPSGSKLMTTTTTTTKWNPLRLVLHLSNPPVKELVMANTIEVAKSSFNNSLKEADFTRWRNTSRSTNIRRADMDSGWDGLMNGDYDAYFKLSSRLIPLPIPLPPSSSSTQAPPPAFPSSITAPGTTNAGANPHTRPSSTDPSGQQRVTDSSYSVRALPIKIYLPDGAPVVHEVITPIGSDGQPSTLLNTLRTFLPALFPSNKEYKLAVPITQGIVLPPETELAWLCSCLCGADGWLRIGIQLVGS